MKAYHGSQEIKDAALAKIRAHAEADQLVKGIYWENGKGCAVGCQIESGNHMEYETRFGIPVALARLEDAIFENLPNDLAMMWPMRFMAAASPGGGGGGGGGGGVDTLRRQANRIDGGSGMTDLIEEIAQFLHDEGGFSEAYSGHTWPDHPDDTGRRDGGYVKIVPTHARVRNQKGK